MTSYTNIHSHFRTTGQLCHIHSIYNKFDELPADELVSLGIHPWYIKEDNIDAELEQIKKHASASNVLAIGECGLDKLINVIKEIQEHVFKEQIRIAEEKDKPLIIHCVKAFDDLIRIKKEMKINVPLIVHGYNNNQQIAEQLLKNGFCFSFGKALLQENSNASNIIRIVPVDKLFLETDDADISIQSIFGAAAVLIQTDEEKLKQQLYQNFKTVFKYE